MINPREKLRALDLAAMVNEPPPPIPWVVEPLIVRGALTLLAGIAGQGKSLLSMAFAITATRPHVTALAGMTIEPGRVVIVDAENGRAEIHRRIHALGLDKDALGLDKDALPRLTIIEADGFDLAADLNDLEAMLDAQRPTLLVLDSWRSLWRGDERDEAEVASVLDSLRNLVRRHDTGALLIHHARRDGSGYRGSGAIAASVELAFLLDREPEDPDTNRRRLRCEKSRPAPEPPPQWLRLAGEPGLANGAPLIAEAEPFCKPERERAVITADLAAEIPALLHGRNAMRCADIARALLRDPSDGTVRRAMARAERAGEIEQLRDGRWTVASQNGNRSGNPDNGVAKLPGA